MAVGTIRALWLLAMSFRRTLGLLLALSAAVACQQPEPTSPVVGLTLPVDPPQPPDLGNVVDRDITIHVYLGEELRHYCVGVDPFFHYESDHLTQQEQTGLFVLVACMETGALKDKRIMLNGRADPRGTVAYNDALGLERAERVKKFLVDHGVASDRVVTGSLGKTGAAPARDQWRTDRRVDIAVLQ